MRLGFAGLGWAARGFHVPALREVPSVELVGGFDTSPEQRASWERETGKPAYASLEELLERGRPEALSIATPPATHYGLLLSALDAGLHVFCEKPFVETLEQADRVLAAAEERGLQIAVNHEFREKPIFKAIRDTIVSGEVGRLVFCQIWQLMDLPPWEEHVAWRAAGSHGWSKAFAGRRSHAIRGARASTARASCCRRSWPRSRKTASRPRAAARRGRRWP